MGISAFFKKFKKTKDAPAEPKVQPVNTPAPKAAQVIRAAPKPKPQPVASVSPLSLTGGAKNQSDWLLLQIGKTGRSFIASADKSKLTVAKPEIKDGAFVRHDMTAALLGYRMVLTAYHFHQDVPSLEALRIVRTAMTGMLHRAVDITVEQTGAKERRGEMLADAEAQFKSAEKEIMEACFQLRGKSSEPFKGFYASLIPAFGHQDSPHELHRRFGALLAELYSKIESAMAARNHQITG